jgi:hypothetical protein
MPRDPTDTKGTIARRGERSEVDVHWLCASDELVGHLEFEERLQPGTSLPLTLDSGWRLLVLITGDENRFKAQFRQF